MTTFRHYIVRILILASWLSLTTNCTSKGEISEAAAELTDATNSRPTGGGPTTTTTVAPSVCNGSNIAAAILAGNTSGTYTLWGAGSSVDPYQICSASQLYELSQHPEHWDKNFLQTANLDLAAYYSGGGSSFKIGRCTLTNDHFCIDTTADQFRGVYDGGGFTISGFSLTSSGVNGQALFSHLKNATLKNMVLANFSVVNTSASAVNIGGALVAFAENSTFTNIQATGLQVTKYGWAGGIVGVMSNGTMTNVSSLSVNMYSPTGWLVGAVVGGAIGATLEKLTASGNVESQWQGGGLVGILHSNSILKKSSSSTTVTCAAGAHVGGLVGMMSSGTAGEYLATIEDSYATGSVISNGTWCNYSGGLVGYAYRGSVIKRSYASGAQVVGGDQTGGLVGRFEGASGYSSYIYNSFSVVAQIKSGNTWNDGRLTGSYGSFVGTSSAYGETSQVCYDPAYVLSTSGCYRVAESGTDSLVNFYSSSHAVYTGGSFAWDFSAIWKTNTGALPTLY